MAWAMAPYGTHKPSQPPFLESIFPNTSEPLKALHLHQDHCQASSAEFGGRDLMTVLKEGYSLPELHAQNASIRGSRFEIGQVLQTLFVVAQTQRIQLVQQDLGHLYSVFIRGLRSGKQYQQLVKPNVCNFSTSSALSFRSPEVSFWIRSASF